MSKKVLVLAAILAVAMSSVSFAQGNGKGNGNGNGVGDGTDDTGHHTATFSVTNEVTTELVFMGMSQKAPPNPRAAASQGTRTETQTTIEVWEVVVEGPPGQIKQLGDDLPASYELGSVDVEGCNNCDVLSETLVDEIEGPTEITDLPGANR